MTTPRIAPAIAWVAAAAGVSRLAHVGRWRPCTLTTPVLAGRMQDAAVTRCYRQISPSMWPNRGPVGQTSHFAIISGWFSLPNLFGDGKETRLGGQTSAGTETRVRLVSPSLLQGP